METLICFKQYFQIPDEIPFQMRKQNARTRKHISTTFLAEFKESLRKFFVWVRNCCQIACNFFES